MFTPIMLLIVAATSIGAIMLTRQWVLEHRGVDLDEDAMETQDIEQFSNRQKVILALLVAPLLIFLISSLLYVVAAVVVASVGISTPPA